MNAAFLVLTAVLSWCNMEIFYPFCVCMCLCLLPENSHLDYKWVDKVAKLFYDELLSKPLMFVVVVVLVVFWGGGGWGKGKSHLMPHSFSKARGKNVSHNSPIQKAKTVSVKKLFVRPEKRVIIPMCKCRFYFGMEYIYVFTLAVSEKNFWSMLEFCKDARVAFMFAVLSCQQAEAM